MNSIVHYFCFTQQRQQAYPHKNMDTMLQDISSPRVHNIYDNAYLPAGLDKSAARRQPERGAPSMKADQGEGCEGEAGTFASELPATSQKYADLSSKPRAMHASTIKWRIFPTEGIHRLRLLEHSKYTSSTIS